MEKIDKVTRIEILITDEGGADVLQWEQGNKTYCVSGIKQGGNYFT